MLYREPKLLKGGHRVKIAADVTVSVLYREPKLLKASGTGAAPCRTPAVSVLYREPKLLKVILIRADAACRMGFSALP